MPPRTPQPTPLGLEFVQKLKAAIRQKDATDYISLKHRVPVRPSGGGRPVTVMFEVSLSPGGLCVATCHEFPGLVVTGDDEHEALIMAELRVRHLLAGARR